MHMYVLIKSCLDYTLIGVKSCTNMQVIAVATLIGVGVFKEQLNRINMLGLLLAVGCAAVLFLA